MQKDTIVEISIFQCQKIPEEMRIGLEKYFSSFGNSKEPIFLIQKPLKKTENKKLSHVSRIVPKTLRGSFGVFQHPFCYKLSNFKGTLWRHRKIFERSLIQKTGWGSLIVWKKVERGTLLLWNGFYFILEALDAFKLMKY